MREDCADFLAAAAQNGKRPEKLVCDVHAETGNMQKANTMNTTQFATIAAPQDVWGDPNSIRTERTRFEKVLASLLHFFFPNGVDPAPEDDGGSIAQMATSRSFLDACVEVAEAQEGTYTKELCAILLPQLRELATQHICAFFEDSTGQLMPYFSAVFHGECNAAFCVWGLWATIGGGAGAAVP